MLSLKFLAGGFLSRAAGRTTQRKLAESSLGQREDREARSESVELVRKARALTASERL
jgi:hypothetical protein